MAHSIVTETASRLFAALADPQTINQAKNRAGPRPDDAGWLPPLWTALADAGLPLAWVPDTLGGAGAGIDDGFEVGCVSGRFAAPAPVAETLLAGWLLARAGIASPTGMLTLAPVRPRDRITVTADGRLSGRARNVPFATLAGHLAVFVEGHAEDRKGGCVALVDAASCRIEPARGLAGVPAGDVTFSASVPRVIRPAPPGLDRAVVMQMGAAMRAMETAGALQALLDLTVTYAQERVAFGKPIAKFQAIQHALARLAGEVAAAMTAARSAADAITAVDADPACFDDGIFLEVAAARIRSAEAATEAVAIAHQVHGAIGFTREHVLHRYTMRLLSWRDDFGNESQWALDLGTRVAAAGADALWPTLAAR